MSVELIKTPLKACKIIGDEISGAVVEEDINVPDINPDVYKILYPSAKVIIKNSEATNDKVIVDGQVLMDILYAAETEGRPLSSLNISADFTHIIDVDGAKPGMKEWIDATIQHVDCHIINSRKIGIKVIMDLGCTVEDIYEMEIPMDVRGSDHIQVLREPLNVKGIAGMNKDKFNVKEEIQIEGDKAPVKEILKTDYWAYIKDSLCMEGKVQGFGSLCYNILYKSTEDEMENTRGEIPYTQYIEIPEADEGMEATVFSKVRETNTFITEDIEGEKRNIALNVNIDISGRAYKEVKPEILTDMYNPKQEIVMGKKGYDLDEYLCKGKNDAIIKESIKIKQGAPEAKEVFFLDAKPLIYETKVMDDKVGIEGIVSVCALYKSSYSGEPMSSATEEFPFKIIVDAIGAKTTMQPKASCNVESITYSVSGRDSIDIRIALVAGVHVYNRVNKVLICDIEEQDGVKYDHSLLPAVTIYVVAPGDTLWKIAKKYNTTVDDLADLNNIGNPDVLKVGQKILILKSIRQ